jgi:hypothetical protein
MLTRDTLHDHKKAIALNDMPKTFRDAVLITRKLGFQYLWIDSLCIVQDDPQDWQLEATRMGDVYANATITIMAVAATSADTGCFVELGSKLKVPGFAAVTNNLPCELGNIHLTATCEDHANGHDFSLFAHHQSPSKWAQRKYSVRPRGPLDDRGWVFQEEMLSLRTIAFGQDGMYWECLELAASDSDPCGRRPCNEMSYHDGLSDGVVNGIHSEDFLNQRFKGCLVPTMAEHNAPTNNLENQHTLNKSTGFDTWLKMVENFTSRVLTQNSDRLIAIDGIARELGRVFHDEYYAGLWLRGLPLQLLWRRVNREMIMRGFCGCFQNRGFHMGTFILDSSRSCYAGLFPSWSWAAAAGPVSFESPEEPLSVVEIRSVNCWQEGNCLRGRIKLSGVVRVCYAWVNADVTMNPTEKAR